MTKFGLKRIPAPKSWDIKKKIIRFTIRPFPGGSNYQEGLALGTIMRDYLKLVNTMREAKHAVNHQDILINNHKKTDIHHIVGLMDVLSFPSLDKHFRLLINKKGKLQLNKLNKEEVDICPLKIKKITYLKKGIEQINLSNGRNILTKNKKFKPGDTLVLFNKDNKVKEHFKLEKGNFVFLISGKHVGERGTIELINGNTIAIKTKEKKILETKKKYAYVLGTTKSIIQLIE